VQLASLEAGSPRLAHRRHEIHQGDDSCRPIGWQEELRAGGMGAVVAGLHRVGWDLQLSSMVRARGGPLSSWPAKRT
jgi:hypothetical protein